MKKNLTVHTGSTSLKSDDHSIHKVVNIHYDTRDDFSDDCRSALILEVDHPFDFTKDSIQPVPLALPHKDIKSDSVAEILNWDFESKHNQLRAIYVTGIDKHCKSYNVDYQNTIEDCKFDCIPNFKKNATVALGAPYLIDDKQAGFVLDSVDRSGAVLMIENLKFSRKFIERFSKQ